jgi:hypothetical protein
VRLRDSLALRTALAAGFGASVALVIAWTLWGDHVFARLRADLAFLGGSDAVVVGTPPATLAPLHRPRPPLPRPAGRRAQRSAASRSS